MTNKQIMADLGQALLVSELKTSDKLTNTGVTYDDTTTINSRSIGMGSYDGSTDYQTFNASKIKLDRKIISFWVKPDFDSGTGGFYDYAFSSLRDEDATSGMYGISIFGNMLANYWEFAIYEDGTLAAPIVRRTYPFQSANTLTHFVLFIDNEAGLEDSKSMSLYVDGALYSTNTPTWDLAPMYATSYLGAKNDSAYFYDGGIYDFCIFDF